MGRPRKSKSADPFADLDNEFKDAISTMTPEQINLRIAEVAKNEEENQRLKKEDLQLAELKEQVKEAGAQYAEGTKANRLKIRFAVRVLSDKGQA